MSLLQSGRVSEKPRPLLETPEEDKKKKVAFFLPEGCDLPGQECRGGATSAKTHSSLGDAMKNAMAHGEAGHRDDSLPNGMLWKSHAAHPTEEKTISRGVFVVGGRGRGEGRCKWTFLSSGGQLFRLSAASSPPEGRLSIKGEIDSAPWRQGPRGRGILALSQLTPHRSVIDSQSVDEVTD